MLAFRIRHNPVVAAAGFEDVIVQKDPAAPVYCEHSFVTWSCPFRAECADTRLLGLEFCWA